MSTTLLNIRINGDLLEEYKDLCTEKNSNVSNELREFIKREVQLRNSVKTKQSGREQHSDFRDFLDDSTLHGNFKSPYDYKDDDYVPKKKRLSMS